MVFFTYLNTCLRSLWSQWCWLIFAFEKGGGGEREKEKRGVGRSSERRSESWLDWRESRGGMGIQWAERERGSAYEEGRGFGVRVNAACTAVLWNYSYEHCQGLEKERKAKEKRTEGGRETLQSLLMLDAEKSVWEDRRKRGGAPEELHTILSSLQFLIGLLSLIAGVVIGTASHRVYLCVRLCHSLFHFNRFIHSS